MRVGEINTYTEIKLIANDRALLESSGNPQDEEERKFNKPVERQSRQTYVETSDVRIFQR